MSLQHDVLNMEHLFKKQKPSEPFIQGIMGECSFANVFTKCFLSQQGFENIIIDCGSLDYIRYQDEDAFLEQALREALDKASTLSRPMIVLESFETLYSSKRNGKGREFIWDLIHHPERLAVVMAHDNTDNTNHTDTMEMKKEKEMEQHSVPRPIYIPLVLSTQDFFQQRILETFKLPDYPFIDEEDLRASKVLRKLYDKALIEKHEFYHTITQQQNDIQVQKLKEEKAIMKKAMAKEKKKMKYGFPPPGGYSDIF